MTGGIQPPASHFVDGAWVEDQDGPALDVVYPATGKVVARVHGATDAVLDRALASAAGAQTEWAATDPAERGRILRRAADLIRARNRDLSELETLDTGKPLQETLVADAASGADALEYFGALAADIRGETMRFGADWAYTIRRPLGVCAGIGAWNYPTQIACWKAAPALAAGNAMVFKPSEATPLGALRIAEILHEAGLPAGLFNVVQGDGRVGATLTTDRRVAKVSLTGSVPTGREVAGAAAGAMKHVTMELGGKSPLLIFEDADLGDAVSGAINGNFYSSGQVCSNGTRVFVQRGLRDAFVSRLTERLAGVVIGDPLDEATNYGPMTTEAQMRIVLDHIGRARAEGATVGAGGTRIDREGYWIEPTILTDLTDDMACVREEIFGPVLSVLTFEDEDEAIARANATGFGLAAGIFTRDLTRAHRVAAAMQAGTIWINQYNLTPAGMPFGGSKMSGIGRENARAALDHYTEVQTIYVGMGPVEAAY
ncbi:betaine-aldehyde dehydrogenase [Jannaschia aquimarina]|uniref:BetB protein n=1 Tax=Jannaschia aquimarina TaxID=935700 RepID=A0A0D1EKI9_9RHOB|nr:betaine-aldehyde dehydrogenase [Jannaschia aquimarina]KIT17541.1 NAD/NADP-dependent betaine aldehyde dehydrogenase [Jannaschia aquimarina]SNS73329.1 betaine aldehyde dehydrogenase [Jannaschia aquimarina]